VGLEKLGREDEGAIRALGGFGGGIASSGQVCGILLGGVAAISSLYSRGNLEERENPRLWAASHKYLKRFELLVQEHGGTNCFDIARVNWRDREAVMEFYKGADSRRNVCAELVAQAAHALGEILDQEEEKQRAGARQS
jgi:C_GCAxxG_C_C family probable redox protein